MYKNLKFILIVFVCSFFIHTQVYASVLSVDTTNELIKTGDSLVVSVLLDTENESINTIEGDLIFDSVVKPESIETNKSFISFWVEQPSINSSNKIHFSGIVPGGITTNNGHVFSITFKSLSQGQTVFSLENANLFLNDGLATASVVKIQKKVVKVSNDATSVSIQKEEADTVKPEDFNIERAQSSSLFDNHYFIVFNTQDKGTGVQDYSVCEFFYKCTKTDSPYLLKNQTIFYRVSVVAYDVVGNTTRSSLTSIYFKILFILIIILVLFIIGYLYYRYLRKNRVYYDSHEKIKNFQ